jgi:hypothetical protein
VVAVAAGDRLVVSNLGRVLGNGVLAVGVVECHAFYGTEREREKVLVKRRWDVDVGLGGTEGGQSYRSLLYSSLWSSLELSSQGKGYKARVQSKAGRSRTYILKPTNCAKHDQ